MTKSMKAAIVAMVIAFAFMATSGIVVTQMGDGAVYDGDKRFRR